MPDVDMQKKSSKAPTESGELNTSVSVEEVVIDQKPETLEEEESGLGIGLRDILLIVGVLLVALLGLGGLIFFFKKRQVLITNKFRPYY